MEKFKIHRLSQSLIEGVSGKAGTGLQRVRFRSFVNNILDPKIIFHQNSGHYGFYSFHSLHNEKEGKYRKLRKVGYYISRRITDTPYKSAVENHCHHCSAAGADGEIAAVAKRIVEALEMLGRQ